MSPKGGEHQTSRAPSRAGMGVIPLQTLGARARGPSGSQSESRRSLLAGHRGADVGDTTGDRVPRRPKQHNPWLRATSCARPSSSRTFLQDALPIALRGPRVLGVSKDKVVP